MCKIHGPGRPCLSRAPYGRGKNAAAAAARQRADNRSGDTRGGLAAADAARGRRGSAAAARGPDRLAGRRHGCAWEPPRTRGPTRPGPAGLRNPMQDNEKIRTRESMALLRELRGQALLAPETPRRGRVPRTENLGSHGPTGPPRRRPARGVWQGLGRLCQTSGRERGSGYRRAASASAPAPQCTTPH